MLAFVVAGFSIGLTLGRTHGLEAAVSSGTQDTDGDGLMDHEEAIMGTDMVMTDSDSDGFSDFEEIARQSDPNDGLSVPLANPVSAGFVGRAELNGTLHVILLLYLDNGSLSGVDLEFGFGLFGQKVELSPLIYLPASTITFEDPFLTNPNAKVMRLDLAIPTNLVVSLGSLSFYALSGPPMAPKPTVAATLDLVTAGSVVMMVQDDPGGQSMSGFSDTVYKPLTPDPGIPMTWTENEYCAQTSMVTGAGPGFITKTIVSAQCKEADAFCKPGCTTADMMGQTMNCFDPVSLLGG